MICSDCPPDPVAHPVLAFPHGASAYTEPDFDTRSGHHFVPRGERLVVLAREGRFAKVRVATSRGPTIKLWVNEKDGRLVRTSYSLVVRRSKRDVLLFRHGRRISRMRATVGAPSTPTPKGVFTITRYRFKPNEAPFGTYGCCVLSLDITVFAPFGNQTWGNIGIHRNFGGDLGRASSHGCIRIPFERVRWLYQNLPIGTLVKIV